MDLKSQAIPLEVYLVAISTISDKFEELQTQSSPLEQLNKQKEIHNKVLSEKKELLKEIEDLVLINDTDRDLIIDQTKQLD